MPPILCRNSHFMNHLIKKCLSPLRRQTFYMFNYKPHFNWVPQLEHVLQPPISSTLPFLHIGHVSPTSEPIVTSVFSKGETVSTRTTFFSSSSNSSVCSENSFSSAFSVNT